MPRVEREPASEREREPEPGPRGPEPAAASSNAVLALQRTAGNAAVTALLQRLPTAAPPAAETPAVAELRKLLTDEAEKQAIAQMGRLSQPEADRVLADPGLRELAVSAFGNTTMARAMAALTTGDLAGRLRWMFEEGTSWKLVRPLLSDPVSTAEQRLRLYAQTDIRSRFSDICDDDEMAEAVGLLGGTLEQRLNWMFVEGTNWKAVYALLSDRKTFGADERKHVLTKDYLRDFFKGLCNSNEMLQAVRLLGGTLEQRLRWLFATDPPWLLVRVLLIDKSVEDNERIALYPKNDLRAAFSEACGDDEMAEAVSLLGGTLAQKLNWMFVEGTSWKAVRPLIADPKLPKDQKQRIWELDDMKPWFVGICSNKEMAEAVKLLEGKLVKQLEWMIEEGTSGPLVFDVIRRSPDAEQMKPPLPMWLQKGLRSELSGSEYQLAVRMLTEGVLTAGSIDESRTESHLELKDPKDPTKGYESVDFRVESIYDIEYARTALRVKVGIKLTGEPTDAAHRKIWTDGIENKWNGKFHVENGRRIPIVFVPQFGGPKTHHEVEIHPPVAKADWREDAANWYAGPRHAGTPETGPPAQDTTGPNTAAHEFGHLLGMADEYNLAAADYQRVIGTPAPAGPMPASGYTDSTSLMGDVSGDVKGRHMAPFVAWLNKNRAPGDKPYRLVAGP